VATSDDFPDDSGPGGFLRLGWQDDAAAVDYRTLYSGGIDISGSAWGRAADNIGLGYAWVDGANSDTDRTDVAEAYYRLVLADGLAVSAELQYMKHDMGSGPGAGGFLCGLRATAEF
jgi:carbohydrate-selective porin OprB